MPNPQNEDFKRFLEEICAQAPLKIVISHPTDRPKSDLADTTLPAFGKDLPASAADAPASMSEANKCLPETGKQSFDKVLSDGVPGDTAVPYRKITITRKQTADRVFYQAECNTKTQAFHRNFAPEELRSVLAEYLYEGYRQINVFASNGTLEGRISKKGKLHISRSSASTVHIVPESGHNRQKQYLLPPELPLFYELGITAKDGHVRSTMYDKYRQINRFAELLRDAVRNLPDRELHILDFGCGKSYLTFVVYYYLTTVQRRKVHLCGLDLKADVIEHCNALAKRCGYDGLHFEVGDINGYRSPYPTDLVLTLHACDTATDYALYNAVQWEASAILSVPCCQHEVNAQMRSDTLSALTKYGIIKERTAALVTDAIRGCMLEYCGYEVNLVEFVDAAHSPKNIMIRAVRRNVSQEKRQKAYDEALRLAKEFHAEQTLMKLLMST